MANSNGSGDTFNLGFDPDTIPDKEFKEIPPGKYILEIVKADYTKSEKTGRPMFKLELKIAAGEFEGVPMFENVTLPMDNSKEEVEKHAWKLVRLMRAITDNKKWKAAAVKPADLVGGRIVADLHHEEYDGRRYARIRNASYDGLSTWKGVVPKSPKDVAAAAAANPVGDDEEVA